MFKIPIQIYTLVDEYKKCPQVLKPVKIQMISKELESYLLLELNYADVANSYNAIQEYKTNFINKIK